MKLKRACFNFIYSKACWLPCSQTGFGISCVSLSKNVWFIFFLNKQNRKPPLGYLNISGILWLNIKQWTMLVCFQLPHSPLSAPTWSPPLGRFWATSGLILQTGQATRPAAPLRSRSYSCPQLSPAQWCGQCHQVSLSGWVAGWVAGPSAGTAKALHLHQSRGAERELRYSWVGASYCCSIQVPPA